MALDGSDKKTVVVIDLMIHIVIFVILVITYVSQYIFCFDSRNMCEKQNIVGFQ